MGRIATSLFAVVIACGSERGGAGQGRESTRVEMALEGALQARVGVPLRVRCAWLPPTCRADLPDGSAMRVWIGVVEGGEVEWRLDGRLVLADDIEGYLREVMAELGAPQVVSCGARVRVVQAGERVECALQRGGKAFVIANEDGTSTVEIQLERAAGDARAEVVTIERDVELEEMSSRLDGGNDGASTEEAEDE